MNISGLKNTKPTCCRLASIAFTAVLVLAVPAAAHWFVPKTERTGAYPWYEGDGWIGVVYLNLPDSAVVNTIQAEDYIADKTPDFTFRTRWIDFPAGPDAYTVDSELETVGDFLDDYIFDVSDPAMLDEPMSNMVIRFTGLLKVRITDEVRIRDLIALPIWIEFGSFGYDGYNARLGGVLFYERFNTNQTEPWFNYGPSVQVEGLYPIEVTYFNQYDPDGSKGAPFAGFELYSWHGSEFDYPAGENMMHAERGQGTLAPPRIIYQPGDELPVPAGDFNADASVDLIDFQWFQNCFFPPDGFIILPDGCDAFDFAPDNDVDWDDLFELEDVLEGP